MMKATQQDDKNTVSISDTISTTPSISVPVGGGKFATVPVVAFSTNQRWVVHHTIRSIDGDKVTLDRSLYTISFVSRGLALSRVLTRAQALYLIERLPYFDTNFKHVSKEERKYRTFMQRWRKVALAMDITP